MKIESIKIKNVKSFKDETTIKFGKKLNLIIGPNGSGKSNLLDVVSIVLRYFFLQSYTFGERNDPFEERDINITQSAFVSINKHLEPFVGCNEDSLIEIGLIVGKNDINNMIAIKNNKDIYQQIVSKTFYNKPPELQGENSLAFLDDWDLGKLRKNQVVKYQIIKNSLAGVNKNDKTPEGIFLSYLWYFDLFFQLAEEVGDIDLRPVYIYFSPYRIIDKQVGLQLNPSEDLYQSLAGYLNTTSRLTSSLIKISGLYFARKRRRFESEAKNTGYGKRWSKDSENVEINSYLGQIGYRWDLRLKGRNKGTYEFYFDKEDKEFMLGQASSGEKEIFNFLFGILAFIKRDGLYLIDEPELHLHPNWQNLLMRLLIELSKKTNSQFIISTHSPLFVTQDTLSDVIRFYKNSDNSTNQIRIPQNKTKSSKELLHIVNSQNNEKMFFADKVVLVEGVIDRLIIKKLIERYSKQKSKNEVIEVLDVGTKNYLQKYRDFLELIKVKNYILADQDYLSDIGNQDIKKYYLSDKRKIKKDVFKNKTSLDLDNLIETLDGIEKSRDCAQLIKFWRSIKKRKTKIKRLDKSEKQALKSFIKNKRSDGLFILSKGEIENYFPIGNHNLDMVIEFVKDKKFEEWIKKGKGQKKKEIIEIIKNIVNS